MAWICHILAASDVFRNCENRENGEQSCGCFACRIVYRFGDGRIGLAVWLAHAQRDGMGVSDRRRIGGRGVQSADVRLDRGEVWVIEMIAEMIFESFFNLFKETVKALNVNRK